MKHRNSSSISAPLKTKRSVIVPPALQRRTVCATLSHLGSETEKEQKAKRLGLHIDPELHCKLNCLPACAGRSINGELLRLARRELETSKKSMEKSSCRRLRKNKCKDK